MGIKWAQFKKKAQSSILSGSFCDPRREKVEVFRRDDTYACALIHFSSALRKKSHFLSVNSNVKTSHQRNCHVAGGGLVIKL